jgi:hypothetical protein
LVITTGTNLSSLFEDYKLWVQNGHDLQGTLRQGFEVAGVTPVGGPVAGVVVAAEALTSLAQSERISSKLVITAKRF